MNTTAPRRHADHPVRSARHRPGDPTAIDEDPPPVADDNDGQPGSPATERPVPLFVRVRIALVRAFLMTWARAFSLSGLYLLGQVFGAIEYLVDYNRRRRVHAKLQEYFKDDRPWSWRHLMACRYFMRVRCDKMFYTIMDRLPRNKLMNRIKLLGGQNLDAGLDRGKGVYVALCHFGAHHVAGLLAALLGYRLAGIRDPKESHVRRYIQKKYRESFPEVAGMKMFLASSFPREIFRQFRQNKLVASLLDAERVRGDNTRTRPVRIFGETREFLVGPLQIAIRCGATTLQGFVESRKNFYYRLIATPPLIDPDSVTDEGATIADAIQRYADGVEQFARAHPDHLMNI